MIDGPSKPRLDKLLVARGIFATRHKAQGAIMAGEGYVDGERVDKAGTRVASDAKLEYRGDTMPYVGRGGLKLEKALRVFSIDLKGAVALDIGASTGGFTDCMLQQGAVKVYAVDVGYGQLAWKLRKDPRVVVVERTNARYLTREALNLDGVRCQPLPSFASIDVSFISLAKILPAAGSVLSGSCSGVALVKPQFEAGPDLVGSGGIVREASTHRLVLNQVLGAVTGAGFDVGGLDYSPITGADGNLEFLLHFRRQLAEQHPPAQDLQELVDTVVEDGHEELLRRRT